ncbi:hypothetical protein ILUMI_23923 [Ignelater luminosus]|uniref:Kinesin motor domain-containing protein n=1 Tax=Ignelater luminosus TaxID=2038154 RepID=A0A8K0FWR6_IGNLU|nr:hypothetical protein ILUMI_23923 [Ignelater luminosus]
MERRANSKLHACDLSILTCGPYGNNIPNGVQHSSSSTCIEQNKNQIHVYLRVKKIDAAIEELYDICDDNTLICKPPADAHCMRRLKKVFKFSKIFGPDANQSDIFNNIVKRKVLSFINGSNCNLLTYGVSASGKTYTIVGTPDQPGLIPRALEYLFRTLPPLPEVPHVKPTALGETIYLSDSQKQVEKDANHVLLTISAFNSYRKQHIQTYRVMQERLSDEPVAEILSDATNISLGVWVSFAEIYNECIYDLLIFKPTAQKRKRLALGYYKGDAYIKDLTSIYVKSSSQAYQILQYGLHKLKYAATSLNDHSSRSHFIFTLKLVFSSSAQEAYSVNTFTFCDLAGSERFKKTQNLGIRLNESAKINTSFAVLGRCIELIRKSKGCPSSIVIPFRESKLTQILQKALLGYETISMIINISPAKDMFDETQHVLHFSAIAKDAKIDQQPIATTTFSDYIENDNSFSAIMLEEEALQNSRIDELETRIAELIENIEQQKVHNKEEREYIMATYKKHLAAAHEYWENRCRKLEQIVDMNRLDRKKITTINLDSSLSSDEENKNQAYFDKKNPNISRSSLADLQGELVELKRQHRMKDAEIDQLLIDKSDLEKAIKDTKAAHANLEMECKAVIKNLQNEVDNRQNIINTLSFTYENYSIWVDDEYEQILK